jgi:hypothetical protein
VVYTELGKSQVEVQDTEEKKEEEGRRKEERKGGKE